MNIHEYQAKAILASYGIPVPRGIPILSLDQIEPSINSCNYNIIVLKAQIHAGGRGKAGGIKICKSKKEAIDYAKDMLGMTLTTHQTGNEGQEVRRLYIEEGSSITKEYYLSIVLDRESQCLTFVASKEGGMDIEEVATEAPEKIIKVNIDPATGILDFHTRKIAFGLGLEGKVAKELMHIATKLYSICLDKDAIQVEINPLVITKDEKVIALDAKINFDSNALYRHQDIAALRDKAEEDQLETRAIEAGLSYVKMGGNIGCMVNGAGLAMATMDIIKLYGEEPANFLDVGGSATKERVTEALKIILSDKNVKAILINIFGGIMRCDILAEGIVAAEQELGISIPVVVRLLGTNCELGNKILSNSGLKILIADTLQDAAQQVVNSI